MMEGIDNPEAAIAFGDISSGIANAAFHRFDGIRGTGGANGESPVEHGKIVIMITGRENLAAFDPDEAREFAQGRALAVSLMAKPQVDGVAHEIEPRHPRAFSLEKNADLIHLSIGIRDDSDHAITVEFEMRPGLAIEPGMDIGQQGAGLRKKPVVIGCTTLVPIAIILPLPVGGAAKYFTLRGQDEIRSDWKTEFNNPRFDVPENTAGIDRPEDSFAFQRNQGFEQLRRDRRCAAMLDQGAIEIGAKQFDH